MHDLIVGKKNEKRRPRKISLHQNINLAFVCHGLVLRTTSAIYTRVTEWHWAAGDICVARRSLIWLWVIQLVIQAALYQFLRTFLWSTSITCNLIPPYICSIIIRKRHLKNVKKYLEIFFYTLKNWSISYFFSAFFIFFSFSIYKHNIIYVYIYLCYITNIIYTYMYIKYIWLYNRI